MLHEDTSNSPVIQDHFNDRIAREAELFKALGNYLETMIEQLSYIYFDLK